jgi:hypothetical protein
MGKTSSSLWRKKDRNGARAPSAVVVVVVEGKKKSWGSRRVVSSPVPRRRRRGSTSDRDRVTQLSKYHVELMCDTVVC